MFRIVVFPLTFLTPLRMYPFVYAESKATKYISLLCLICKINNLSCIERIKKEKVRRPRGFPHKF